MADIEIFCQTLCQQSFSELLIFSAFSFLLLDLLLA